MGAGSEVSRIIEEFKCDIEEQHTIHHERYPSFQEKFTMKAQILIVLEKFLHPNNIIGRMIETPKNWDCCELRTYLTLDWPRERVNESSFSEYMATLVGMVVEACPIGDPHGTDNMRRQNLKKKVS
ncbi:hypothetical protein FQR65_LT01595 [Abscondita terminalis]|nr:hypothetical protein FQR65_LT01595 [Abscondita terminalis]